MPYAVILYELVELLLAPRRSSSAGGYLVIKAQPVAKHGCLAVLQVAYLTLKVVHLAGMACVLLLQFAYARSVFGYQAVALAYGAFCLVDAFAVIERKRQDKQKTTQNANNTLRHTPSLYLSRS